MSTYTILSATYADAEHTVAIMQCEIFGSVVVSKCDRPDFWAEVHDGTIEIADYVPPPAPEPPVAPSTYPQGGPIALA